VPGQAVTRQIAKRSLKLWPLVCVIDEAQNLFADPQHGKAAGLDAEFIIKIGPAFGVVLIIATQRPDKASLPTGVSGNVSTRFCLKVMGQVENDMILGTSAYKNGLRATTFRPEIDAGLGYLLGAGPAPQVVRTFYLDMHAAERIAIRARALREAAGTLTGHAAEGADEGPRDVLTDVLSVFGSDSGLQWATRGAARLPVPGPLGRVTADASRPSAGRRNAERQRSAPRCGMPPRRRRALAVPSDPRPGRWRPP
jgi:S-DNA-T family DNA segregation ATPase FtsK/SpoIIIE